MYLFGEPGLEKDELAALIHFGSTRRNSPMARVDCAQLNPSRAAELLGSMRPQSWLAKLEGGSLLLNNVHQVWASRPGCLDAVLTSCHTRRHTTGALVVCVQPS